MSNAQKERIETLNQDLREVQKTLEEILHQCDRFLQTLEENVQCLRAPHFNRLLRWAHEITYTPEGNIKPAAKRAAALAIARPRVRSDDSIDNALEAFAIRDQVHKCALLLCSDLGLKLNLGTNSSFDIDLDLYFRLERISHVELDNILGRAIIFAREFTEKKVLKDVDFNSLINQLTNLIDHTKKQNLYETQQTIVQQVFSLWYDTLNLQPEIVEFSTEDLKAFYQYLEANRAMILLKNAARAAQMPVSVWQDIENRLLLPSEE
jgi:hypothetical protein